MKTRTTAEGMVNRRKVGKRLLGRLYDYICKKLTANSSKDEIIEIILEALTALLPGGKIIKRIVERIIKFIINSGIALICKVKPA